MYTGVTNDSVRRMSEHNEKAVESFSSRYNVNKLVYLEEFALPKEAIAAEKKIKGWTRKKKIDLIKQDNPEMIDLSKK